MSEKKIEIKEFLTNLEELLRNAPKEFVYIISGTISQDFKQQMNAGITAASGSSSDLTLSLYQSFSHSPQFRDIIEHSVRCRECEEKFANHN